jgi:hypothetical protein
MANMMTRLTILMQAGLVDVRIWDETQYVTCLNILEGICACWNKLNNQFQGE